MTNARPEDVDTGFKIVTVAGNDWRIPTVVADALAEAERLNGVYFKTATDNGMLAREAAATIESLRAALERINTLCMTADRISGVDPMELSSTVLKRSKP